MQRRTIVEGKVVAGHGVASGRSADPRFPDGTLALQWPIFRGLGLDLEPFYRGTINVSVAPLTPEPGIPSATFRAVEWHPGSTEDFSFFDIELEVEGWEPVAAYVYRPHPETKPEHFQDPHVVEILAPKLEGIAVGVQVRIWADERQMRFV